MTERTKRKEREEERKIIRNRTTTTRRFPVQFFRYSSFSFPESRLRRCADYSREGRTNGRSLRTTSRFIRFSDFIPREDCVRFVTLFCRFRRWMVSTIRQVETEGKYSGPKSIVEEEEVTEDLPEEKLKQENRSRINSCQFCRIMFY